MLAARPPAFTALAAIAVVEGTVLLGYAVYDLVQGARLGTPGPEAVSNAPALSVQILIFLGFGAGLLVTGLGWWRGRRWARAPFLLAQLLAVVIGFPLAQADGAVERPIGIVLVILAVAGAVLALSPRVTRALFEESGD